MSFRILKNTWLVVLCVLSLPCFAQSIPFDRSAFKDQRDGLKQAEGAIKEADKIMESDFIAYDRALELYLEANAFNPNNAELNFKIGYCYLKSNSFDRTKALEHLEKSYALDPGHNKAIHFYHGQALQLNYKFAEAIKEFEDFTAKNGRDKNLQNELKQAQKQIQECKDGIELVKSPVRVYIENIGNTVNSKYPEFGAVITADEELLFFTSRRDDTMGGQLDQDYHYFEDIYFSERQGGKWSKPLNLGKPVNTPNHDATVSITPDGTRMILYIEGDLYESDLEGKEWGKPKKLPNEINTKYHETSASFSADGKQLYFVSDRADMTLGGHDIFVADIDEKGRFGKPRNLGPVINTEYEEEGVFMHPDGKTMYFSSKGHNTMGGYDIFRSELVDGQWGKPVNLGHPVNTPDDDVFFVMNAKGNRGYYASVRKDDGFGEKDIYVITFLGDKKPPLLTTEDNLLASIAHPVAGIPVTPVSTGSAGKVTVFKGLTLDSLSKVPVGANMTVTDNKSGILINETVSNRVTGKFLLTLPVGRNYNVTFKADGYMFHSENFDIPEGGITGQVEEEVLLKKIEIGNKVILKNIFFDFDKSTLRDESVTELNNLKEFMNNNPSVRIELSGHTDSRGSAAYNLRLSDSRAKAVHDWLVKNGIAANRLESKGYGLDKPIATNSTDEGRQLNRRTEFLITGK